MKRLIVVLAVALAGCANVTTMKISRTPNGALTIDSGKDVSLDHLTYESPSGEKLDVSGYSSNANSAAIDAQTAREKQVLEGFIDALKAGAALRP